MRYITGENNNLDGKIAKYFGDHPEVMTVTVLKWNEESYIQWLGDRQDSEDLRDQYEQSQIKFLKALKHLDKVSKICAVCGKDFTASKAAKFCSNACRQKNKYQNSKK